MHHPHHSCCTTCWFVLSQDVHAQVFSFFSSVLYTNSGQATWAGGVQPDLNCLSRPRALQIAEGPSVIIVGNWIYFFLCYDSLPFSFMMYGFLNVKKNSWNISSEAHTRSIRLFFDGIPL